MNRRLNFSTRIDTLKIKLAYLPAMVMVFVEGLIDSALNFLDVVQGMARLHPAMLRRYARALALLGINLALGLGMLYAAWWGLADYLSKVRLDESEGLRSSQILNVVPPPDTVWEAWQEEKVQAAIELHTESSLRRLLRAMFIATAAAWPLGLLLGQSRLLNRLFAPVLALIYPIPKVVFLPVFLIVYGINDDSKIALIVSIVFFQILVVVRDEAQRLPPDLLASVRSLGAGRRALYWFVYLPASLGSILTAWRVSVGPAVAVLYIAEITVGNEGLGYYINNRGTKLRYDEMFVGIIAMSILGIGIYMLTDIAERLFLRWK